MKRILPVLASLFVVSCGENTSSSEANVLQNQLSGPTFASLLRQDTFGILPASLQGFRIQASQTSSQDIIVEYFVDSYNIEHRELLGKTFQYIEIPGMNNIQDQGLPALPRLSRNIHLQENSSYQVEVLEEKFTNLESLPILPGKGSIERSQNPDLVPYTFGNIYHESVNFEGNHLKLSKGFKLRGVYGASLEIVPVVHNPQTHETKLRTYLKIRLSTQDPFQRITYPQDSLSDLVASSFLNPPPFTQTRALQDEGSLLFIVHDSFLEAITPLQQWKIEKGMNVEILPLSQIGTDPIQIRELIKTKYEKENLAFVVLVGDAEYVPYFKGTNLNVKDKEADPMYALVDGNDSYPDLVISRISAQTPQDVLVQVNKILKYEKDPLEGNWYQNTLGIASNEGSPKDWERMNWVKDILVKKDYTFLTEYDPQAKKQTLIEKLNQGVGYINYMGHGSKTSWGTTGFANYDIDALKNGYMNPFITDVACVNGQFGSGSDSFAERWMKAGTPENPQGALSIFASSTNQAWVPPTIGQKAMAQAIVDGTFSTLGALFFHASIAVLQDNDREAIQTFQSWHIFGDGSVQIRTKSPEELKPQYEDKLNPKKKWEIKNLPEGAKVSLTSNLQKIGFQKVVDGKAIFENLNLQGVKKVTLTITQFNARPYQKEILVEGGSSPEPTPVPTAAPTIAPTPVPTAVPTIAPTPVPTAVPTIAPTPVPTAVPTVVPTATPSPISWQQTYRGNIGYNESIFYPQEGFWGGKGQLVKISLQGNFWNFGADLDLFLKKYENGQWKTVAKSENAGSTESIQYTISQEGNYHIEVKAIGRGGKYILQAHVK